MAENNLNIVGIIPARMGSSRFPGKPLAKILGMPMIGHVYHRAKKSQLLREVYLTTYDFEQGIIDYADSIGAKVAKVNQSYDRASDITAHAVREIEKETGEKVDIVVMIQGDEPMITPEMIDVAVQPFLTDPSIKVVNLMAEIKSDEEYHDPNCPKVVVDKDNFALYFSREPIPSRKKWTTKAPPTFKQVCVIPFTRDFLLEFNNLEPTMLEKVESIDMNRVLSHGHKVKMILFDLDTHCVDTQEDLILVEKLMANDLLMKEYFS